jgi:hypothetical protein
MAFTEIYLRYEITPYHSSVTVYCIVCTLRYSISCMHAHRMYMYVMYVFRLYVDGLVLMPSNRQKYLNSVTETT